MTCENPRCTRKLTKEQIRRGGRFCGNLCGRSNQRYRQWNRDPYVLDREGRIGGSEI